MASHEIYSRDFLNGEEGDENRLKTKVDLLDDV